MHAVVITEPGGFNKLQLKEVPDLIPEDNKVLIDIAYSGCNWADTQLRKGIYPHPVTYPFNLGFEIAGTVIKCGEAVTNVVIGDRVAAILPEAGGYAEKCVVGAEWLIPIPESIPLEVAAAFPIQALTAYHMLHTIYRINKDDFVLVHAAGGGVGLCVTQMAILENATVIGTVGTKGKEVKPLAYGASCVVNLNDDDFVAYALDATQGKGVDLAIDSLGGEILDRTFEAVCLLGHIINIGEAQGQPYQNIRERILPRSQTFTRFHLLHVELNNPAWQKGIDYVLKHLASKALEIPIVEIFALEDAAEMHERLESRSVSGKLLLGINKG